MLILRIYQEQAIILKGFKVRTPVGANALG